MASLLMTRPRAAAETFVAALPSELRVRLTPVYSPLIEIVATADVVDFGDACGIVFSSANGVGVAARLTDRRDLPCFCVGAATTRAARAAGWQADCVGEDADALVQALVGSPTKAPLLHLRGIHARGDIAGRLSRAGHVAREQTIYDQRLLPLTDAALTALNGASPVIAPIFSPRTARQFANCVTGQAPLLLAALSKAVAEPLYSLTFRALEVAERPDAEAMVKTVVILAERAIRVEGGSDAQ